MQVGSGTLPYGTVQYYYATGLGGYGELVSGKVLTWSLILRSAAVFLHGKPSTSPHIALVHSIHLADDLYHIRRLLQHIIYWLEHFSSSLASFCVLSRSFSTTFQRARFRQNWLLQLDGYRELYSVTSCDPEALTTATLLLPELHTLSNRRAVRFSHITVLLLVS